MALTTDALWLNSFFNGYDSAILGFAHKLAGAAGSVLTPLNKLITFLGEGGILFFLIALLLLLFPRWRRTGLCVILSIAVGAVFTNLIFKGLVARPRPFEASELYRQWWQAVGSPAESGYSFPSGHVTAAAAAVTGFCLVRGRKFLVPGIVWVLLMMFSRNYLMTHYPSDVLFAALIGIFSAFLGYGLTALIYRFLENRSGEKPIYDMLLDSGPESFKDIKDAAAGLREKQKRPSDPAPLSSDSSQAERPSHQHSHVSASSGKHKSARHESSASGTYQGKH